MLKILPGLAIALSFPLFYLLLQIVIKMELPSTTASYTCRVLTVAIMGLLFFYSFNKGKLKATWSILHLSLLIFMLLYAFRIFTLNDEATWRLDPELYPFSKVSMLFIFGSIAPFVMALFSAKLFVQRSTCNTYMLLTFISVVIVAVLNIDQFGVFRTKGFEAGSISSLSMGYLAALAIAYCILDMFRLKRFPLFLLVPVLLGAVFLLSVSSSRGPLLAMGVSVMYILLTMKKTAFNVFSSVLALTVLVLGSVWFFNYSGSGIMYRLEGTSSEESRLDLYNEALAIIEANFLFGKDIALSNGYWPHNFVIEAFMAVGLFGFLLVIPWLFAILKTIVDYQNEDSQWLYVWFIQTSVMNMFTEAIWAGSSLFICLCLVIGSGTQKRKDKKRKRRRRRRRPLDLDSMEHA
jgi:O-antigen ligase